MLTLILLLEMVLGLTPNDTERPCLIVVAGTPGTPEYRSQFDQWAERWKAAGAQGGAEVISIGRTEENGATDHDRLKTALGEKTAGTEPLWLVLIGHGTYDGKEAKFNLRGPDVTDTELASWIAAIKRPVVVIDCASSSAPFLNKLSETNRIVVTATRSGTEQNYARFGEYLSEAIGDLSADLDKDGQVSLLEAFLVASNRTNDFYKSKSRLATEHALIDDNGDHLGTPAEFFQGVRATRKAKDGRAPDGLRAHQLPLIPSDREKALSPETRQKRNDLELAIARLQDLRASLKEDDYYARLEPLMLNLARVYRDNPASKPNPEPAKPRQ